ncbi:Helix-turn-helix domain-containing protein [Vibrio crassostreae]|uniref:Helix-turn-helix domain-containing protein n=3 Tax=Vibrio TaxID=662 RepID=A0AB35N5M2_VIBSP|nr:MULTISPECIES: helix-turn-helix domain-containing protein [Vibrio]MDP2503977.1 helix-turn-helix domain-containing protein [Vibrio splendidus]CAK1691391.1 Helix-turn-helix domain-containing protein [Vibrio crassostreae]CAK1693110.1 Helix-turn-helix domain-containing protein [Vibrio crassostreae]CAK1693603.1 Helix-turn-helix domain-containing protein [Vibrio crassostreae]CAK1710611.1 Helix-turn-helix domain-containing protein [Vibrio crassostreae]
MASATVNTTFNKSEFDDSSLKSALATRLDRLISDMLDEQDLVTLASLNDIELTQSFYQQILDNHSEISPREKRKLKKRAEAERGFFEDLEKLGGTLKAKDVAELLGVKRQTVNNRLKNKKLLGIRRGGNYIYPAFQFKDGEMLPHFESLNQTLPEHMDAVARISFFICNINDGGSNVTSPLILLNKKQLSETELKRLRHSASLQETHVAK